MVKYKKRLGFQSNNTTTNNEKKTKRKKERKNKENPRCGSQQRERVCAVKDEW
jgi:hypothetical protein